MSTQTSNTISPRPFLKWAGGKSQLIQQYIPYFPKNFQTYYEPFLGGAAVFFYLYSQPSTGVPQAPRPSAELGVRRAQPSRQTPRRTAFLTDVNLELVNVYRCVRDRVEEVIQLLKKHQQQHNCDYYYQVRSLAEGTEVEKAARLIYLNKTCFNGLYRENTKGEFNVPIGRYKNPKICDLDLLLLASEVLRLTKIEVSTFETVLNRAKSSQDFVYFDPPYYPLSSTSSFTAYNRYSFSEEDQIRLRDTFATLARREVKVMLSNSDCPLIRELYKDFKIHTISASRTINSNAKKRGKITEVLVTSY